MPIFVGSASSTTISQYSVSIGSTDTTGRDAGIGTANGQVIYNASTFELQVFYDGVWKGGLTTPFSATGGTLDSSSRPGFNIHTFTGSGSLEVTSGSGTAEYLVIAGGGGGKSSGGGGGAGGYRTGTSFPLTPGTYTIQVGSGGAGAVYLGSVGTQGTPSFITNPGITSVTSSGGGYGDAGPGGSGGGAGYSGAAGTGNVGGYTPPEGNDGGTGHTGSGTGDGYLSGGGGGAGAVGGPAPSGTVAGTGGNGSSSSITGTSVTRAGGGGAGGDNFRVTNAARPGGSGGGGNGGDSGDLNQFNPAPGTAGTTNTGSGGGGGNNSGNGGPGGSGIVIIAYPTA